MSARRELEIKSCSAKPKELLIRPILKVQATTVAAYHEFDLTHFEARCWINLTEAGMEKVAA